MQRRILRTITLALLLVALVDLAMAQEEPSEQLKIDALKLGYALNGNSMVRWGSIDLTSIIHNPYHPYIRPDFIGPPAPPKLEPEK